MRSSPMTEPAQVNGEPICRVTGMPASAWRRESSRAMGSAPAVVTSSGALESEGVVLAAHRVPGDHRRARVLLVGELDLAAELPAPRRGVGVERPAVVAVHLLAEELAAEALRGVVVDAGQRLPAHEGGVAEDEGDHRHAVGLLAPHDRSHPLGARHRLGPHWSQPPLELIDRRTSALRRRCPAASAPPARPPWRSRRSRRRPIRRRGAATAARRRR